jgi:ATP-dependent protease ClpP protease subunit
MKRVFSRAPEGLRSEVSQGALGRWNPAIQAAEKDDDRTISMYDVIGQDWWTGEGVTAKRVAGALRSLGKGPVTVNLNSPGGDMFEGIAIYNLLKEHPGDVTVRVLGIAASAASVIAMAGDRVQVGRGAFLMIHNASVMAAGNRNDLVEIADWLEPFDAAMAEIYAERTGMDAKRVAKLMDAETYMNASAAVEDGFADEVLGDEAVKEGEKATASAVRRVEAALRGAGLPRSEAMRILSEIKSGLSDSAGGGGEPRRILSDSGAWQTLAARAAAMTLTVPK